MPQPKRKSQNKSEFIRTQPPELSAVDVVKKAKEAGLVITRQWVYSIRSATRSKDPSRAPVPVPRSSRPRASEDRAPQEFLALVALLGLSKTEQLLAAFRASVASIGGA